MPEAHANIAAPPMSRQEAKSILAYLGRTYAADKMRSDSARQALRQGCIPQQLEVMGNDIDPLIGVVAGRRAGKTTLGSRLLYLGSYDHPNAFSLYLGITRLNAKKLLWPEIKRLNDNLGLGGKPNESDLTMTMPNGHMIFLGGTDTAPEIEKYRSFKYSTVVLDECGSMGAHIQSLVEDVLEPATIDCNGQIYAIGTPAPTCAGYFYGLTRPDKPQVPVYHWTCLDNPYLPNAPAFLSRVMAKHGWDESHPTYQREWMGRWVDDHTALCYAYDPVRNAWDGVLPDMGGVPWEYTLGVDVGYSPDPTGFVVLAYSRVSTDAYVVMAEKQLEMLPSAIAQRMDRIAERYPISRMVVDVSGSQGLVEEWRQRFRVPLHAPLNKASKREHIHLLNDDFRTGRLRVRDGLPLIDELRTIVWDEKRKGPDDRYPNDLADALEYAWTASRHYAGKPHQPTPQLTQEARLAQEEQQHEQAALRRVRRQQRRDAGAW